MRPAQRGIGALRWIPSVLSTRRRTSGLRIVQLATGAVGVPRRPVTVGRAIRRSRRGTPCSAFITARAWELISAIFTPWGQTWVQMPQLEQ